MRKIRYAYAGMAVLIASVLAGALASTQRNSEIMISRQLGILYMPAHIMENQKLIEKHAARLGLANVTTKWITFSNGRAQTDALLAGSVDIRHWKPAAIM